MYPFINQYGFHCGHDGSRNLSLGERKGFIQIICNSHNKELGNIVCSIDDLSRITKSTFDNFSVPADKRKEITDKICTQLSTNVYELKYDKENEEFKLI